MLCSLVYVSAAARPLNADDLKNILTTARENNASLNITGMLLYHDGNFIQVLEGEQETVNTIFEKISRDPRHTNIIRVVQEPIRERLFTGWSMGFRDVGLLDADQQNSVNDFLAASHKPPTPENINRSWVFLSSFKNHLR